MTELEEEAIQGVQQLLELFATPEGRNKLCSSMVPSLKRRLAYRRTHRRNVPWAELTPEVTTIYIANTMESDNLGDLFLHITRAMNTIVSREARRARLRDLEFIPEESPEGFKGFILRQYYVGKGIQEPTDVNEYAERALNEPDFDWRNEVQ